MPPSAGSPATRPSPAPVAGRQGWTRRLLRPGLALVTVILVADALVGDNGYFAHQKERQRHAEVRRALEETQQENRSLRERARRLKEADPGTIEEIARRKLGMAKPGEVLFIVRDREPRP